MLLLRRTLASTVVAVNTPAKGLRNRSTLARGGVGLGVEVAHVNIATKSSIMLMMGNNKNKKNNNNNNNSNNFRSKNRLYMLCSPSPTYSSSSSSSFEERNNNNKKKKKKNNFRVLKSSISRDEFLVADMGHEKNDENGVVSPEKIKSSESKLLTLPTLLTLARVAAIPIFIATFYVNSWWGAAATTSIFIIAAITDWLDGYLARKMGLGTAFGAFLDPVADKLMVAATLVLLCSRPPEISMLGDLPWLFPVPATAIIGREITMSAVREWAASQNTKLLQAVAVNNLGKWKTATQMTALTILLATRDSSLTDSGALATSGVVLLYISAGLAVWSLVVYMKKIWKVLLK